MIIEARRDVVTLRGALTENQWPAIQAAARTLLEEHPQGIIIDCGQLTEITEAGAKTFLDGLRYIQRCDARIIVAGLPEDALEVVRGVRAVVSQLPTAPSVEDARASLGLDDLATREPGKGMRIVAVLLMGDWQKAAQIACAVSDRRRDELHFVDMIKVPRNIPLATPLPEAEAAARRKLGEVERIAKDCKVSMVRRVERVRSAAEGVQRLLSELKPAVFVVCLERIDEDGREIVQMMPGLLADPPCEVVYVRRPEVVR